MDSFSFYHQEEVIHIENLKKKYRLGVIGSGTLQGDIQSFFARLFKKEDPNQKINQKNYTHEEDFWALKGINLSIYRGETLGIIGGNGAGKSTLLKILSRVTAPTSGQIKVKGKIASMLEVGTGFHRELTGRENIYLNGAIMGMSVKEIDERIDEIIEFAEIETFIDTPVKRYSSGMYVKLAFSVAAHLNADILIMDEVLAVGDALFQKKCINKMQQLASQEGKTVLFVSHNMNTISQMCNRCVVLKNGEVQFVGECAKAIEMYYQQYQDKQSAFQDLSMKKRPQKRLFPLHMQSFHFLDKDMIEYVAGEPIKGTLCFHSTIDVTNVCVRMTLLHNGIPIGTCFSSCIEDIKKEETYETEFVFQTDMLACGLYTVNLGMYRHTKEGIHSPLDFIENAFAFEITKAKIENRKWQHRTNGSVIFNEAKIIHHNIRGENRHENTKRS